MRKSNRDDVRRGGAGGAITAAEHGVFNRVVEEHKLYEDKYSEHSFEDDLGVRNLVHIQVSPEELEVKTKTGITGHWGARYKSADRTDYIHEGAEGFYIYLAGEIFNKLAPDAQAKLAKHEISEHIRVVQWGFVLFGKKHRNRTIKEIGEQGLAVKNDDKNKEFNSLIDWLKKAVEQSQRDKILEELVNWLNKDGDRKEVKAKLDEYHKRAYPLPKAAKKLIAYISPALQEIVPYQILVELITFCAETGLEIPVETVHRQKFFESLVSKKFMIEGIEINVENYRDIESAIETYAQFHNIGYTEEEMLEEANTIIEANTRYVRGAAHYVEITKGMLDDITELLGITSAEVLAVFDGGPGYKAFSIGRQIQYMEVERTRKFLEFIYERKRDAFKGLVDIDKLKIAVVSGDRVKEIRFYEALDLLVLPIVRVPIFDPLKLDPDPYGRTYDGLLAQIITALGSPDLTVLRRANELKTFPLKMLPDSVKPHGIKDIGGIVFARQFNRHLDRIAGHNEQDKIEIARALRSLLDAVPESNPKEARKMILRLLKGSPTKEEVLRNIESKQPIRIREAVVGV